MRKKVSLVLLVAVLSAGYAQAQVNIGAHAGVNFSNMLFEYPKSYINLTTYKFKPGYQIGALVEIDKEDTPIGFQSGLLIATQGCKTETTIFGSTTKTTISLTYLQIPLNSVGIFTLKGTPFIYHVGINLGFAVAGKTKTDGGKEEKIIFGSGKDAFMKGFDLGSSAGVGYQFGNIQAKLVIYSSLLNFSNNKDVKMRNLGLSLTATYFFGE